MADTIPFRAPGFFIKSFIHLLCSREGISDKSGHFDFFCYSSFFNLTHLFSGGFDIFPYIRIYAAFSPSQWAGDLLPNLLSDMASATIFCRFHKDFRR